MAKPPKLSPSIHPAPSRNPIADMTMDGRFTGMALMQTYLSESLDDLDLRDSLDRFAQTLAAGDMSQVECMLASQAVALQGMFTDLALRARKAYYGRVCWLIYPVDARPWQVVRGGRSVPVVITPGHRVDHPDAWLMPVTPEGKIRKGKRRAVKRSPKPCRCPCDGVEASAFKGCVLLPVALATAAVWHRDASAPRGSAVAGLAYDTCTQAPVSAYYIGDLCPLSSVSGRTDDLDPMSDPCCFPNISTRGAQFRRPGPY